MPPSYGSHASFFERPPYHYDTFEEEKQPCWSFNPCGTLWRAKAAAGGTRVAPVERERYAADMIAAVQQRKAALMPTRSASRKLTPYPGKTAVANLQHLEMIAPVHASGMHRGGLHRSHGRLSSSSSIAASRASSICANSGAKPVRPGGRHGKRSKDRGANRDGSDGSGRSGSASNEDSSGHNSRTSGSSGLSSGDMGSGGTGQDSRGTSRGTGSSGYSGDSVYSRCSYDSIDWSRPPQSLLEASMRRVAMNERAELERTERERLKAMRKYPRAIKVFSEKFFRGLVNGYTQWASAEQVESCFHEEVVMMTHDGQMYYGRVAVIKRLNRGMDRLLKMLGKQRGKNKDFDLARLQEMGVECCDPVQEDEGTWRVVYNMKKGVLQYSFEDEFIMEDNGSQVVIKKLTRRLVR